MGYSTSQRIRHTMQRVLLLNMSAYMLSTVSDFTLYIIPNQSLKWQVLQLNYDVYRSVCTYRLVGTGRVSVCIWSRVRGQFPTGSTYIHTVLVRYLSNAMA